MDNLVQINREYGKYEIRDKKTMENQDDLEINEKKLREELIEKIRVNREDLEKALPIVVVNGRKQIYKIEKKIRELTKKSENQEELVKEIRKLRRYSYDIYIQNNL